ncbi:MAG: S41 family peptidase [Pyrinomonadaceae bacterium]
MNSRLTFGILRRTSVAIVFLTFGLSVAFYHFPVLATDANIVSTSTREGRLAVFDDVWSAINDRYYDRNFHGLDWGAQRTTFRALAMETQSGPELYMLLRRMIAPLNDPHTRVFSPEEKFDWWRPRFVSTGIALKEVGGLPTVVQVEKGSAPDRAGLRAGDVITVVNAEPASAMVNRRLQRGVVTTGSARSRAFASILEGPAETTVEVRWQGKQGQGSAQFKRRWQHRDLGLRVHKENGDYFIVEIDAFTNVIARDFANLLRERIKEMRGIVIDLRSNGGGDAGAMTSIASAFLGQGRNLGQFTDRFGSGFTISTLSTFVLLADRSAQSRLESQLPLVVLTSERTASAAEIFIAALKTGRRAMIIGTETCGCVLAIRNRHVLPDGGLLDISEMDYHTASGERLEGHGITPDKTVALERSDLYFGKDRALEAAIAKLRSVRGR